MATPWQIIEAKPEAAAALSWRRWLGPAFEAVAAVCLRETRRTVERIPCENGCDCNHAVRKRGTALVGVCDCGEDCEDVPLTAADVKVWELDLTRLARASAKALACTALAKPFGSRRVVHVATLGNPPVPVLLMIQPDTERYQSAIAQLAVKFSKGFILLTPTKLTDAEAMDLASRSNAGLYDLESNFDLAAAGTLHSTKDGLELFSANLPATRDAMTDTEAVRIFGILQKLRSKRAGVTAPLFDVFNVVVMERTNYRAAAKKCGCSLGTLTTRIRELEAEFGMTIKRLQAFAGRLLDMQTSVKGQRTAKKKQGAPGDEPEQYLDHTGGENEDGYLPEEL